jgi:hypothetical protein
MEYYCALLCQQTCCLNTFVAAVKGFMEKKVKSVVYLNFSASALTKYTRLHWHYGNKDLAKHNSYQ